MKENLGKTVFKKIIVSLVCHDGQHDLIRNDACTVEHAGGGNGGGRPIATTTTLSPSCPPPIISRSEWGAREPTGRTPIEQPVPRVLIHRTVSRSCYSQSRCALITRAIQNFHMDNEGNENCEMLCGVFTARCYAELGIAAVYCPSGPLSVRLSVTLRYVFHTGWSTSKITSRSNSLRTWLWGTPNKGHLLRREHPQNWG